MTTKRAKTATLDLSDLTRVRLAIGDHAPGGEACVMEAVSVYAGEPWSDRPVTTDPALAVYLRSINDRSPQWVRDEIALRVPRIARAHTLPAQTRWMWAEAARQLAIRVLGPVHGAALVRCHPIIDRDTADAAARAANAAYAVAHAAASASRAAAYAAYAAYAVAYADAWAVAAHAADAATYAASASRAAAYAVAHAAAYAADAAAHADDAHRSTGEWRQALALVDRMLDLATEAEP